MEIEESKLLVTGFIEQFTGGCKVDYSSDILPSTGLGGIEADMFFEAFSEKFSIDMRTFDYQKYYADDADMLNWPKIIWKRLLGKLPQRQNLTIEHLAEVVRKGKWIDP